MKTIFIGNIHRRLCMATGMPDRIGTHNGQLAIFDHSFLAMFIVAGRVAAKQVDE